MHGCRSASFVWMRTFCLQSVVRKASTHRRRTILRQRKASHNSTSASIAPIAMLFTILYAGEEADADLTTKVYFCICGVVHLRRRASAASCICGVVHLRRRASATSCICDPQIRLCCTALHCCTVLYCPRPPDSLVLHCAVLSSILRLAVALCCPRSPQTRCCTVLSLSLIHI